MALALAGCGPSTVSHTSPGGDTRDAAMRALKLWSRFPAAAVPRPIVLLDGPVLDPNIGSLSRYDPQLRRVLHPQALLAFEASRFVLHTQLPLTLDRFRGWRVIGAEQAFDILLRTPAEKREGQPSPRMRLPITGARLTLGSFSTDRGQRDLPVWAFTVHGLRQPVRVLAVPRSRVFMPPVSWAGENATVSDSGRVIRLAFVGGLAGDKPCDQSYTAGSVADNRAVAVWLVDHPVKTGGDRLCIAIGTLRTVLVHIDKPLGSRALIESFGAPVPVCWSHALPQVDAAESCRS
jgi:hypothetical protein